MQRHLHPRGVGKIISAPFVPQFLSALYHPMQTLLALLSPGFQSHGAHARRWFNPCIFDVVLNFVQSANMVAALDA
jgi:hypothetical protein